MRTLTAAVGIFITATALFGAVLTAQAKGPLRAEVSGADLDAPVTIEGPLPPELVFGNDSLSAPAPEKGRPAYTLKLMPEQPDGLTGEYPVIMTLTYFPADGEASAVLSGDWDNGERYFGATLEFQAMLDNAIHGSKPDTQTDGDDGASPVWYIAPSLAGVGLMIAGGLAGRRLLFRHDE